MSEIKYKRILLKLSGEALAGENKTDITIGRWCLTPTWATQRQLKYFT